MARIRSIHPGFFTDEAMVTLSPQAQVFLFGIWTQCDDQGVFEWKPITLKMRVLPAANVDVSTLLSELESADAIKKVERGGAQYGLVRNFRKYQRPKSPNAIHPMCPEWRNYVGLTATNGETAGDNEDPFPEKGEIPPQMEEGGEERKGEEEEKAFSAFSLAAEKHGWPKPSKLSADRRKKLQARLAEHGGDGWDLMLLKAGASDFLCNEFRLTFDWVLEPRNFRKVIEGNYDGQKAAVKPNVVRFNG